MSAAHNAKSASTPKAGFFAVLSSPLRGPGIGAPSRRLSHLSILAFIVAALLALTAAPALAAPPASFGEPGAGAGQIGAGAKGIAIDQSSGDVYVADTANNRVDRFGPEGEFELAFGWGVADGGAEAQTCGPQATPPTLTCQAGIAGSGAGQLNQPKGIALDNSAGLSQGDVYVTDQSNGRVEKFSPSGAFLLAFAATFSSGSAIALDDAGTVYVGGPSVVHEFSEAGAPAGEVAVPAVDDIRALAVDSTGDLYLTGHNGTTGVHKFDPTGAELGTPGGPTEGLYFAPIAIGPGDQLILVDIEHGRVDVFAPGGAPTGVFTEEAGSFPSIAFGDAIERLYVLDSAHSQVNLLALPPGPYLVPGSEAAAEVEPTTATLTATLRPQGAETEYRFQYGTTTSYGQETPTATLPADFEDHEVTAPITGLQPLTTYHFRLLATSHCNPAEPAEVCETTGPDQTFTTLPPVSIDSTAVSSVSATSATLETELNPHGLPTTYRFEYDTTPYTEGGGPHGKSTPTASAGSGKADLTRTTFIEGLAPQTTYHYRVVAENSLAEGVEAVLGPDRSFTTQGTAVALLPDNRAWELVSPPDKHGVPLEAIERERGTIQAAVDGSGLAYFAAGAIDSEASGNRSVMPSQLLARRSAAGWATQDVSTPHQAPAGALVGSPGEYKLFSADLSLAALEPFGATPLSPATSERTPYLRSDLSGAGFCTESCYLPLVSGCPALPEPCPPTVAAAANVPAGTEFGGDEGSPEQFAAGSGVQFVTATPDLSHLLLNSQHALTEDFALGFKPSETRSNTYEWSAGALTLVSWIPPATATACGPACLPASELGYGSSSSGFRHVVSTDGSRVVFESGSGSADSPSLYLRDLSRGETVALDVAEPECGSCQSGGARQSFQDASADGSRVFFKDDHRLTADSTAESQFPDLYMCQVGVDAEGHLACDLTDLTANTLDPSEPAGVLGTILGASADGSRVYFVANGALTAGEGAVHGDCEEAQQVQASPARSCNLYLADQATDTVRLVAVLSNKDSQDWAAGSRSNFGRFTGRLSPNGRYLAFMSQRPLTGYDNRDAASGARDQEVYLYDAQAPPAQALACASCNPTGARPEGLFEHGGLPPGPLVDRPQLWGEQTLAANIPGWTNIDLVHALYQSRYLSDSGRLFFNAADSLLPADSNGTEDVYSYEPPGVGDCSEAGEAFAALNGGCVSLISSGTSKEESVFLDASASGDDVFFLTASRLTPKDIDGAYDVYDARSGGGEAQPVKPVECSGDACQQPAVPPNDQTPGSLTFQGAGNLAECPKGKVKRSGKCVAKKRRKAHKKHHKAKKSQTKRSANNHRRASR